MSYESQHNAIRARFAAQWGSTTPVAWPNVDFTPPDNTAWVRLNVADADTRQASFGDPGNNVHRHTGLVTVMIFTPLGQGDKEALELADQAAAIFRGWQDSSSGVLFRSPPFVRQIGSEKKWFHLNLLCPFQRDSLL